MKEADHLTDCNDIQECLIRKETFLDRAVAAAKFIEENMQPMPAEFSKIVDDHFWELI